MDACRGAVFKTFGCQMNEYDTQKVAALLHPHYASVESVEDADLVFINSCSVRGKAEHKLFSLLGTFVHAKKLNPNLVIGVGGCVAQQDGASILKRSHVVDFVVGTHNLSLVPSLISNVRAGRGRQVAVDFRDEWEDLPLDFRPAPADVKTNILGKDQASPQVRGLVAIQRGCNKRCSFCVVPTTRGPEVSRKMDEVLREVRAKLACGAREIVLLGQTVNSYGWDLSPRVSFAELVKRVADIAGVERIRFLSPHPCDVKDDFLALYGSVVQLCPHIHLPLQSGSDRILKLMNRNYRRARYLEIVDELKNRCEGISVTSDIIVGFPTETEEDFEETLDVVKQAGFSSSYCFVYSPRSNTKAIERYGSADLVPEQIARARLQRLQDLQNQLNVSYSSQFFDTSVKVLIEGVDKESPYSARGRTPENILVEIEGTQGCQVRVGDLVAVAVSSIWPHGMRGSLAASDANR